MLRVVTDIDEIAQLHRQLVAILHRGFTVRKRREVGSAGRRREYVWNFEAPTGVGVRAWTSASEPSCIRTWLAVGDPEDDTKFDTLLLLSFPARRYSRLQQGVFLRDSAQRAFVGHRQHLARGATVHSKGMVAQLQERRGTVQDGEDKVDLGVITALEDPDAVAQFWGYAAAAHAVVQESRRKASTRQRQRMHGRVAS